MESLPAEELERMDEVELVFEPPSNGGGGPGSEHLGNLYSINQNTDQSAGNADAPAGGGTGDDIDTAYSHTNSRGQTYRGDGPSGPEIARGEPLRGTFTVNIINPKE